MENNRNDQQPKKPRPGQSRSITFWVVALLLLVIAYNLWLGNKSGVKELSYSEMLNIIRAADTKIVEVQIDDKDLILIDQAKARYHTYLPFRDPDLLKEFEAARINVRSLKPSRMMEIILGWLPFLIFIGFWLFMMRSMQGGSSKAFSFGKSRARLFAGGKTRVTFADVAGVEEAKEELEEIVDFLKSPHKFQRLGGRIPRGVLLLGRPGTGKTLLAKAVAGEAGVPFYSMSGSDFVEMFVGVGASRVRDLFEQAKKSAPCIAFIDEIDAVGRHRGSGLGGGHDEREQTLNQLLVEMDGFEKNATVIIIAATNRPDVLDPALLRPGRFDRQVVVDLPDVRGREKILKVHVRPLPMSPSVQLAVIARSTPGFSGADLENLCNEAALLAARKGKKDIGMDDFEEAKDKVMMGKARKSRVISEEEKNTTAYHEVGHVLCSVFQNKTDPVHKVTIIPRGFSGGATHFLQEERSNYSRSYLEQKIAELMGGRAAEELVFGEITTGAGNDIERCTDLAKSMVCRWGMSQKLGPMTIGKDEQNVFLGKEFGRTEIHSDETARLIDEEIREIIHNGYNKAKQILSQRRDLLDKMANLLLDKETLELDEIFALCKESVSGDELEHVNKKFAQAQQFKLDTTHDEEPPVMEEITEEYIDEPESDTKTNTKNTQNRPEDGGSKSQED